MKIHFISNSLRMGSGFGNVTKYLAKGLKELGHEVSMTALQVSYVPDYSFGIEQLPIDTVYVDEVTQLQNNIMLKDPDIVFFVGQMDADMNHLAKVFPRTIAYVPVEGKNIHPKMENDLKQVIRNGGQVVAQCRYGQQEMKKVGISAPYIYHGYNPKVFFPIERNLDIESRFCYFSTEIGQESSDPRILCKNGCYECKLSIKDQLNCKHYKEEIIAFTKFVSTVTNKNELKKGWVQEDIPISRLKDQFKGKFVYLHVGQNFGLRKQHGRLLKSYAIMVDGNRQLRDKTHLHLHSLPTSLQGINLIKIVNDLNIQDNVSFSYGSFRSSSWSENSLNILYNLADVNVTASSSEGHCLPVLEGMSTGLPMIAPDNSSFSELIGTERGYLAKIQAEHMIQDTSIRSLVDESDLAQKMRQIYFSKDEREKFSKNALKFASKYTWHDICIEFEILLKSIIKGR
jgi:glycosyltransferase involved in cell wall biosynthesis